MLTHLTPVSTDTSKGATTTTTAASGAVKVSKPKVTKTAQPSSPKNHKAPEGNNHHKTEASSESPPSKNHHSSVKNDGEDKAVKAERPKTVKRRQYTSRMTGDNIGVLSHPAFIPTLHAARRLADYVFFALRIG